MGGEDRSAFARRYQAEATRLLWSRNAGTFSGMHVLRNCQILRRVSRAPPAGLVGLRPRGPIRVDGGKGTAPLQEYRRTILYGKRHVPMTLAASRETGFHLEINERLKQTRAATERGGVSCFPSAWGRPGGRAAGAVHGSEGPIRCPQQGNVAGAE